MLFGGVWVEWGGGGVANIDNLSFMYMCIQIYWEH
jgi:hypothetical protein